MDQIPRHIDKETPIEERYIYPPVDKWGIRSNEMSSKDKRFLIMKKITDAEVVAITDSDADGYGSLAIIEQAFGTENVAHIESGYSKSTMTPKKALQIILEVHDSMGEKLGLEKIFITDICLDSEDFDGIIPLFDELSQDYEIHIYDHHQWNMDRVNALKEVVEYVVVRQDGELCTTDITLQSLHKKIEERLGEEELKKMAELAKVTRDHDLWIKDDSRSDDLSDLVFWGDRSMYIDAIKENGPNVLEDGEISEFLREKRIEKKKRIQLALENSEWYVFNEKDNGRVVYETLAQKPPEHSLIVGLAYGNVYASETGNQILQKDGDLAVIVQPWNDVSLRSTQDFPYCEELASDIGGGGHPTSAGCSTEILGSNGVVSYEDHWNTEGEKVKQVLLECIRVYLQENKENLVEHDFRWTKEDEPSP